MKRRTAVVRALLASAAIASAIALSGCDTDGVTIPERALKSLSPDMLAEIDRKHMPKESPILVRIFKEEAELEVWKQDDSGRFALLKTYPICRWSGELGPKVKEGDRQAPEGFYDITPGLMNPHSNYYLAFNLGFPNAYDKANDRTGAFLMVHGDCSSRGCYAMTDEQIGEIFALGRDSFFGGQKSFQVQAYPFRMTPLNMARHRNSPHMAFWRMLKEGYDHFEVTQQEPKVSVCEKRYVFDAASPNGAPLNFSPRGRCPVYQVPEDIAAAIRDKQDDDERKFADYVQQGTPTVPIKTGVDGGMHPTFAARLKGRNIFDGLMGSPKIAGAQPGAMGDNVNPPKNVVEDATSSVGGPNAAAYTAPAAERAPPVRVATAVSSPAPSSPRAASGSDGNVLSRMGSSVSKMFGFGGSEPAPPPRISTATPPMPKAAPKVAAVTPRPATPAPPRPQQTAKAAASTANSDQQVADVQATATRTNAASSVMTGAQAPLPGNSFESRWGGSR